MTAATQSTRRKLSLLQLAEERNNVSKACKIMGYHGHTFYEVKRAFQMGGVAGLVEQRRGPRIRIACRKRSKTRSSSTRSNVRRTARSALPTSSGCRTSTSRPAACAASDCATRSRRRTSASCASSDTPRWTGKSGQ